LFTQQDIAMRRKIEILSYSSAKSSTQTNNLTRAQKWAQLVRNTKLSQSFIQANTNQEGQVVLPACPPTPSTSCGVPGPLVYFTKDLNVPLYNYLNPTTTAPYSIQVQPEDKSLWEYFATTDTYCPTSPMTNYTYYPCSTLHIITPINPSYTFTMRIPICIYVEADVSYSGIAVQYTDENAVDVWLSSSSIQVKYSTSPVLIPSTPTYSLSGDYSLNTPMTLSADMMIYPNSNIQSQNPEKNKFFAYAYFGVLTVSDVVLQCQPGYLLDIQLALNFNVRVSGSYSTYFGSSNPTIGAYINPSFETVSTPPQNCTITPTPSVITENTLPQFTMTGI
jgi:hypothetical protein